ncbi:MAG TPA: hypothetical protein VGB37_03475 [Candidatus Lokiarchaeia archaeon]
MYLEIKYNHRCYICCVYGKLENYVLYKWILDFGGYKNHFRIRIFGLLIQIFPHGVYNS